MFGRNQVIIASTGVLISVGEQIVDRIAFMSGLSVRIAVLVIVKVISFHYTHKLC